jgi:hypothetical protein
LVMDVLGENRQVLAMIASRWPAARHDWSAGQVTVHAQLAPGRPGLDEHDHDPKVASGRQSASGTPLLNRDHDFGGALAPLRS